MSIKSVINFILIFGVLYLGNYLFPDYIVSDGTKTLLIATLLSYFIMLVVNLILICLTSLSIKLDTVLGMMISIVYGVIFCLFAPIICMMICSNMLDGFQINGGFTYILLAVTLNIFQITDKETK